MLHFIRSPIGRLNSRQRKGAGYDSVSRKMSFFGSYLFLNPSTLPKMDRCSTGALWTGAGARASCMRTGT